jgi:calcium-dependent protein kinase
MRKRICPFINKIFDCLETSNHIYIVLEFCNEGTLLSLLKKKKRVPEDEALMIIFELAHAMAFLQENNIAHRDIKPENIFVKDGVYKLGDFGFAG